MTKFLELTIAGVAVGAQYALICLGFVIIYKATGVINFAQGALVVIGMYMAYNATNTWHLPFAIAVVVAMAAGALLGVVIEFLILRRMVGQPIFAVIMITLGLLIVLDEVAVSIWGAANLNLGDPWGISSVHAGDITIEVRKLWTIGLTAVAMTGFFILFRYTTIGVAMRATALDQETALAQGISARRVFALSWGIAGAVAALAGVTAGTGSAQVQPAVAALALIAFPAMILGGLDSPGGAVVGGVIIGITQTLTAGYQAEYFSWAGAGFDQVAPYVVMILVLMVRPFGLFGTRDVRRA